MRPGAGRTAIPDPLIWTVLPPERRAAVISLPAMLAARAAARTTGGGRDELARYRLRGEPQQKIRAEHLGRAAVVYVRQCRRSCNSPALRG
jgi:hypothetical protein